MLSPPADLAEDVLARTMARSWGIATASMCYRPVGFGSHHWLVTDTAGIRWFVSVDDLAARRHWSRESFDAAYGRLHAALCAATDLRRSGREFVVAPVPTIDDRPLARVNAGFSLAVYPFVDGESFEWGEFGSVAHRAAVLDLVIATHTASSDVSRRAMTDDFAVPQRDELEAALAGVDPTNGAGPYARDTSLLISDNEVAIRRLLARYDALVPDGLTRRPDVLTHGEPHRGNTMLTIDGWRLIDWDTALVAPPERDLWQLEPGDGSVLSAYTEATGVRPRQSMLELYRIRWELADLAGTVAGFRRQHTGTGNDDESWIVLQSVIARLRDSAR